VSKSLAIRADNVDMNTTTIPNRELERLLQEMAKALHTLNSLLQMNVSMKTSMRCATSEGDIKLSTFAVDFLLSSGGNYTAKTQRVFRTAFNELERILGNVPLAQITEREIERFLTTKRAEASDWTARKHYTALASAFEAARKWGYITRNPWRDVKKPKAREIYPLHLSKDEFECLLKAINDSHFRDLCICAVTTGMRQGELISLRWSDMDLGNRLIKVQNSEVLTTKNKRNRLIPMNDAAYHVLSNRKQTSSCDYVFHRNRRRLNPDTVSREFKSAIRRAGLNDKLHFHSLRHTFATWLVQSNVSLYQVQKLLGHSNVSTTEVYSHLQPERLHDAVNRLPSEFWMNQNSVLS
jgi:integrase